MNLYQTLLGSTAVGCCVVLAGCNTTPKRLDAATFAEPALVSSPVQTVDQPIAAAAEPVSLDTDNDQIPDSADQCLNTPARVLVDSSGCELSMGVIKGLKFAPNQWILNQEAEKILANWVDALQRRPELSIVLEGHTDNRGKAADNLELSKKRVIAVVRFLVENGVDPKSINPFGFGESRPMAANASPEGREINRRIEIKPFNP